MRSCADILNGYRPTLPSVVSLASAEKIHPLNHLTWEYPRAFAMEFWGDWSSNPVDNIQVFLGLFKFIMSKLDLSFPRVVVSHDFSSLKLALWFIWLIRGPPPSPPPPHQTLLITFLQWLPRISVSPFPCCHFAHLFCVSFSSNLLLLIIIIILDRISWCSTSWTQSHNLPA